MLKSKCLSASSISMVQIKVFKSNCLSVSSNSTDFLNIVLKHLSLWGFHFTSALSNDFKLELLLFVFIHAGWGLVLCRLGSFTGSLQVFKASQIC